MCVEPKLCRALVNTIKITIQPTIQTKPTTIQPSSPFGPQPHSSTHPLTCGLSPYINRHPNYCLNRRLYIGAFAYPMYNNNNSKGNWLLGFIGRKPQNPIIQIVPFKEPSFLYLPMPDQIPIHPRTTNQPTTQPPPASSNSSSINSEYICQPVQCYCRW